MQLLATTLVSDQLDLWAALWNPVWTMTSSELKRNNFFSRKAYFSTRHQQLSGRLNNDDGDGNENGKKAMSLDWQNKTCARVSRFFVHFFAVVAWQQRETAYFHVLRRTWTLTRKLFSFSFPKLRCSPLEFNSRKIPLFCRIEGDGILHAIKSEAASSFSLLKWRL